MDSSKGRFALYPVAGGRVLEGRAVEVSGTDLDDAAGRVRWDVEGGDSDWPWLLGWLGSPRGRGSYVTLDDTDDRATLVARLRGVIPLAVAGSSRGGA